MAPATGLSCRRRLLLLLCGLFVFLPAAACRKAETRFEILSFKKPNAPELLHDDGFNPGSFATNAHNHWDIVFEVPPTPLAAGDSASEEDPAADRPRADVWMSQLIHINVFWLPRPGKTLAEKTQTNATILYCLIIGDDVITYQGAGFVYFRKSRDGRTITGELESSNLVPTRRVNKPTDLFGPCRIQGTFVAGQDRKQVVAILRRLQRKLGTPDEPRRASASTLTDRRGSSPQ